jgi:MFS family permease
MAVQQQWPAGTAGAEWRTHWPLVLTGLVGCSLIAFGTVSVGAFIAPLETAFGWSRSDVTAGMIVYAIISALGQPLAGRMIDRFGPRRVGLTGIVLSGCALGLFATANGSLAVWLLLWLIYALAAQLILMGTWSAAVASEFEASRGLAIAVMICGSGLGTTLTPILATLLIDNQGWRTAYVALGAGPSSLALILAWFLFFSRRDRVDASGDDPAMATAGGLTLREGMRSPVFYKLIIASLISYTPVMGIMLHMIPILSSTGLGREQAAAVAGTMGLATLVGKLTCGLLVTRMPGHVLASVVAALPVVTCAMLLTPSDSIALRIVPAAVIGFMGGGHIQLMIYLVTRHFGMRAFGSIFGFLGSALAIAGGIGPVLASYLFDRTGDYHLALMISMPLLIIGSLALLSIGGYPREAESDAVAPGRPSPA